MYYAPNPQDTAFERAEYLVKGPHILFLRQWPDQSCNIFHKTNYTVTHEQSLYYFEVCKQEVENIKKANKWDEYHG